MPFSSAFRDNAINNERHFREPRTIGKANPESIAPLAYYSLMTVFDRQLACYQGIVNPARAAPASLERRPAGLLPTMMESAADA
jgi:hypothetical protein